MSDPAPHSSSSACLHCGLPVSSRLDPDSQAGFCCPGCQFVYRALHDFGLQQYYRLREKAGESLPSPPTPGEQSYLHFDSAGFHDAHVYEVSQGVSQVRLLIEGVHCSACLWVLEQLPKFIVGVIHSELSLASRTLTLRFRSKDVKLSQVASVIDSLGYTAHPYRVSTEDRIREAESRDLLLRLGVAGLCAGNVMLIAVSLYQGMFSGIEQEYKTFLLWMSFFVTLPVLFFSAPYFFRSAWGSLRRGIVHLDLPISVGILAGFLASVLSLFTDGEHVYFDSVCVLVFLLLVGRYAQHRGIVMARRATRSGQGILPESARIVREGQITTVYQSEVQVGDVLELCSGESLIADGIVTSGSGSFDLSFLTGESLPLPLQENQEIFAGTKLAEGACQVKITATGESTRIGRLLRTLEDATSARTPMVQMADRLSRYFVLIVSILALFTFVFWLPSGLHLSVSTTLAFLVITCPCALGLAAPLTLSQAISRASKKGIIIRSAEALEEAAMVKTIYFDKTGTLTRSSLTLERVLTHEGQTIPVRQLRFEDLPQLSGLLSLSSHPVALAVRRHLPKLQSNDSPRLFERFESLPGRGVRGTARDGSEYLLGSLSWLEDEGKLVTVELSEQIRGLQQAGFTLSGFADEHSLLVVFVLSGKLKEGTKESIQILKGLGAKIGILSGDAQAAVSEVAGQLHIPTTLSHAELLPEDKALIIEQAGDGTAFVGDGINDAIALGIARPGIGIKGGLESCLTAGSLFIRSGELSDVVNLFKGAGRTVRLIRINLAISLCYNLLGGTLAICGLVHPLLAAVLMPLSSLTVILSTRCKTF